MKLGSLTACLPDRSLEEIARWAAEHEFEARKVEVGLRIAHATLRPWVR